MDDVEAVTKQMVAAAKEREENDKLRDQAGQGLPNKAAMMAKRRWGLAKQVLESKHAELRKSQAVSGAFKDIVAMARELHEKERELSEAREAEEAGKRAELTVTEKQSLPFGPYAKQG